MTLVVTGLKHGHVSKSDFRNSEVGPTVYRNGSRFSRVLFVASYIHILIYFPLLLPPNSPSSIAHPPWWHFVSLNAGPSCCKLCLSPPEGEVFFAGDVMLTFWVGSDKVFREGFLVKTGHGSYVVSCLLRK